jgi:hypothetical protein
MRLKRRTLAASDHPRHAGYIISPYRHMNILLSVGVVVWVTAWIVGVIQCHHDQISAEASTNDGSSNWTVTFKEVNRF